MHRYSVNECPSGTKVCWLSLPCQVSYSTARQVNPAQLCNPNGGRARPGWQQGWTGWVSCRKPGSSGLCDNMARWSVMFTHARQVSSEILSRSPSAFSKYLQPVTHILHILFLLPSTSNPQPTNSWTLQSTPKNRAKLDRPTSEHGDTCWAWEHPTTGDMCTGLWTHHFLLSHKWTHFGFTFLRTFIRSLALIFPGTLKDLGETTVTMNLLLAPEFPSWINSSASSAFLIIPLFDSLY